MVMTDKKNWYVLITKPRTEQKVASRLEAIGVDVYCPLKTELRQWSDRKKKVKVPILPSMLLVHIEAAKRDQVFSVAGVIRYLFWLGKPAIVSSKEIETLKETLNSDYKKVSVEKYQVGDAMDVEGFGSVKEKGTIKYISGNQCWVVLHNLGFVIKLQI
jgi:transcription antitermination factor NusG